MLAQKTLCIWGLIFMSSCATNFEEDKKNLLATHEKKDLMESFQMPKENADNFKEKDLSPKVELTPAITLTPTPTNQAKKVSKKKALIKIVPPPSLSPKIVKDELVYPDDYPDIFKKYDTNSKNLWPKFQAKFYKGEQSIMAITYLGLTAGHITITSKGIVKLGGRETYNYYARFKSREAYRYLYWLDDYLETFIDKENFLPVKYALVQREKKQNVDDLQLFDTKKLKNYTWYKRVKENANKDEKKDVYIPHYLQDSFSAMQFVRGLPLVIGDTYEFPVTTRAESWILKVEVVGLEVVSINDEDVKAIKIKAETHFPGVLQKSGDIYFWFSADDLRRLLKFQAKVKIGSIYGELKEYHSGTKI